MRKQFQMSEGQMIDLLDACKPMIYIVVGGRGPTSPQERANRAWARLGAELGFDSMTVQPVAGRDLRFFTAETTGAA